jgi:hypothetical protein
MFLKNFENVLKYAFKILNHIICKIKIELLDSVGHEENLYPGPHQIG